MQPLTPTGLAPVKPASHDFRHRRPGPAGAYLDSMNSPLRLAMPFAVLFSTAPAPAAAGTFVLDLQGLAPMPDDHAADGYYALKRDAAGAYVHADYRPGMTAARLALELPAAAREGHHVLRWRWRALVLPSGGDECAAGKGDSAASVYVGWRRGLRWYGLKYAWSAVGKKGAVCDSRRNPFLVGDAVLLESGGPLGTWTDERVDLEAEFRAHFAGGDPKAEVPPLVGIALLTDGDQTGSPSSADFGGFALEVSP